MCLWHMLGEQMMDQILHNMNSFNRAARQKDIDIYIGVSQMSFNMVSNFS